MRRSGNPAPGWLNALDTAPELGETLKQTNEAKARIVVLNSYLDGLSRATDSGWKRQLAMQINAEFEAEIGDLPLQ